MSASSYRVRRAAGLCVGCGKRSKLARCLRCYLKIPGRTAEGYGVGKGRPPRPAGGRRVVAGG